ncbi:MAG: hypothetical protein ACK4UN_19265, partial [Limisphaerales bacterium]
MDPQTLETDQEYQKAKKELEKFGFHQKEKIGELFPTVYLMMKSPRYKPYHHYLRTAWEWFLIASSIWPGEFIPIVTHLVELIRKGKPLPPAMILIMKFANHFPPLEMRLMAARRQQKAHNGEYEDLLNDNEKFVLREEEVQVDPELQKSWEMMKAVFDMASFENDIGVVRRYPVSERGFRLGWKFDPNDPESMMRTALTLLSHPYDLYGFQKDIPLIAKFTANPSAFGTIMLSPKYQATDLARDLNRKTFGEFPKGYGSARKGAKSLAAKRERENEAIRAYSASLRAAELGLKGKERLKYIIK